MRDGPSRSKRRFGLFVVPEIINDAHADATIGIMNNILPVNFQEVGDSDVIMFSRCGSGERRAGALRVEMASVVHV